MKYNVLTVELEWGVYEGLWYYLSTSECFKIISFFLKSQLMNWLGQKVWILNLQPASKSPIGLVKSRLFCSQSFWSASLGQALGSQVILMSWWGFHSEDHWHRGHRWGLHSSWLGLPCSTCSMTLRAFLAAHPPMETWSSVAALVERESTDEGWHRALFSETARGQKLS